MTILKPRLIIIRGERWLSAAQLRADPVAVTDVTQDLIDLADFQLTCLPKWQLGVAPVFRLSTAKDERTGGLWVRLFGSFHAAEDAPADEPSEVIEL